jgi:hypothetical protein
MEKTTAIIKHKTQQKKMLAMQGIDLYTWREYAIYQIRKTLLTGGQTLVE